MLIACILLLALVLIVSLWDDDKDFHAHEEIQSYFEALEEEEANLASSIAEGFAGRSDLTVRVGGRVELSADEASTLDMTLVYESLSVRLKDGREFDLYNVI